MAEIARHVGVIISSIAKEVTRFEKDGMMTDSYGIVNLGHNVQRPLFLFGKYIPRKDNRFRLFRRKLKDYIATQTTC